AERVDRVEALSAAVEQDAVALDGELVQVEAERRRHARRELAQHLQRAGLAAESCRAPPGGGRRRLELRLRGDQARAGERGGRLGRERADERRVAVRQAMVREPEVERAEGDRQS